MSSAILPINQLSEQTVQLTNVHVVNPYTKRDTVQNVYLHQGKLLEQAPTQVDINIDAKGQWLLPSFVDLCARLREPGDTQHGTLASEGLAARCAGFLDVVIPPDTTPILEQGSLLAGLRDKAHQEGGIYLHILGALTQGLHGKSPANLASLKRGGCVGVTNVRHPFANDSTLLHALEYAATYDLKLFFYPETEYLVKDGCVHEGVLATQLGLKGIPAIAETIALAKQLIMVEYTGISAHFSQLSCAQSVELIATAKQKGLKVTADVAMHQLFLTDQEINHFNAQAHVHPPLRSEADRMALLAGIESGVIDAICSHHEPLSASAKLAPFSETEAGISTYDSFVPLLVALHQDYQLPLAKLAQLVSHHPASILDMARIAPRGWVLIDPALSWEITGEAMHSHGKNTPLQGARVTGRATHLFHSI